MPTAAAAHGANPDAPGGAARETALHAAARHGRGPAMIDRLLASGARIDAALGDDARAALARAVHHGRIEALRLMLEAGFPVTSSEGMDATAQHCEPLTQNCVVLFFESATTGDDDEA